MSGAHRHRPRVLVVFDDIPTRKQVESARKAVLRSKYAMKRGPFLKETFTDPWTYVSIIMLIVIALLLFWK